MMIKEVDVIVENDVFYVKANCYITFKIEENSFSHDFGTCRHFDYVPDQILIINIIDLETKIPFIDVRDAPEAMRKMIEAQAMLDANYMIECGSVG